MTCRTTGEADGRCLHQAMYFLCNQAEPVSVGNVAHFFAAAVTQNHYI